MQFITVALLALSTFAAATLTRENESGLAELIRSKVDPVYVLESFSVSDATTGLEKRGCNYSSCDDCLKRAGNCRVCQGPGDHPSACLGCLQICFGSSKCGC